MSFQGITPVDNNRLVWAILLLVPALGILTSACDPALKYGPGQTWNVTATTWNENGLPLLSEPIKEIDHYNNTRQFRQDGVLEGYADPDSSGDLKIYLIRKHDDYDGWLRIEINRTKDNGWIHASWIVTATEVEDPLQTSRPTVEPPTKTPNTLHLSITREQVKQKFQSFTWQREIREENSPMVGMAAQDSRGHMLGMSWRDGSEYIREILYQGKLDPDAYIGLNKAYTESVVLFATNGCEECLEWVEEKRQRIWTVSNYYELTDPYEEDKEFPKKILEIWSDYKYFQVRITAR